ncbi:PKD domain-containing protein [Myxococcus sp. K38C18041901]|uniref:PKD domain-containing protein n=1 Tax=Myxococcus guangdongensis TaxID=2906760 RepID=UPI0020A7DC33|nr:PKD domain-containing protein [Myxococcus guangdongensis]MCP3060110.1 PKD domain-containing protein [Myxococcus guangdongensis]
MRRMLFPVLSATLLLGATSAALAAPTEDPTQTRPENTLNNQTPWIYINHYITNFALDITVGAHDPDGSVAYLVVDFGDGATASVAGNEIITQHVYASPGTYTITVTALDNVNGVSVDRRTVLITGRDST